MTKLWCGQTEPCFTKGLSFAIKAVFLTSIWRFYRHSVALFPCAKGHHGMYRAAIFHGKCFDMPQE